MGPIKVTLTPGLLDILPVNTRACFFNGSVEVQLHRTLEGWTISVGFKVHLCKVTQLLLGLQVTNLQWPFPTFFPSVSPSFLCNLPYGTQIRTGTHYYERVCAPAGPEWHKCSRMSTYFREDEGVFNVTDIVFPGGERQFADGPPSVPEAAQPSKRKLVAGEAAKFPTGTQIRFTVHKPKFFATKSIHGYWKVVGFYQREDRFFDDLEVDEVVFGPASPSLAVDTVSVLGSDSRAYKVATSLSCQRENCTRDPEGRPSVAVSCLENVKPFIHPRDRKPELEDLEDLVGSDS